MVSYFIMKKICKKEKEGEEKVKEIINLKIRSIQIEFVILVLINLGIILSVHFFFGTTDTSKMIIAIVLWGTIIYTIFTLPYMELWKFFFKYKMNLYQYLYAEVKHEVKEEYSALNIVEITMANYCKDMNHIVFTITERSYRKVKKTLVFFTFILSIIYFLYIELRSSFIEKGFDLTFIDLIMIPFTN